MLGATEALVLGKYPVGVYLIEEPFEELRTTSGRRLPRVVLRVHRVSRDTGAETALTWGEINCGEKPQKESDGQHGSPLSGQPGYPCPGGGSVLLGRGLRFSESLWHRHANRDISECGGSR